MSAFSRCLRVVAVPGMVLSLGCSSMSSTSVPMDDPQEPVAEARVPAAKLDEQKVADTHVNEAATSLLPVYFLTDSAKLRPEAIEMLTEHAKLIVDHPEWGLLEIEGHCDERGSDAYNLTLGQRRAEAVERLLVSLGVPPTRLATRTFGSQKPAVYGHEAGAWRYNRRSELRIEETLVSSMH
jgi:peptidoglycan-associated lipoprotein